MRGIDPFLHSPKNGLRIPLVSAALNFYLQGSWNFHPILANPTIKSILLGISLDRELIRLFLAEYVMGKQIVNSSAMFKIIGMLQWLRCRDKLSKEIRR
jgi:hypothetical protein